MDALKIKKGLGRGLSSLIGDTKVDTNINKLSISELVRNKYQPRKSFNQENLDELTNSIKERGIIQPIIVRKSVEQKFKYEIIAGERRWLAAQNAGLHEVPVVITEADDLKSLEFAIVEKIGLNVLIKNKKNNTGTLVLEYKDLDQLNKIIEIIKFNY